MGSLVITILLLIGIIGSIVSLIFGIQALRINLEIGRKLDDIKRRHRGKG